MARRDLMLMSAFVISLVTTASAEDPLSGYEKVRKLAIGGEGGWIFSRLSLAQRLFVTRGTHVVVLDLESEKVIGEIADILRARRRIRCRLEPRVHQQWR